MVVPSWDYVLKIVSFYGILVKTFLEITMHTLSAKLVFHIPHAASLKDKRQISRSLTDKARNKFNASVSEVDTQELHQILTIGVAVVSGDAAHARDSLDEIIRFMDDTADVMGAEMTEVDEVN